MGAGESGRAWRFGHWAPCRGFASPRGANRKFFRIVIGCCSDREGGRARSARSVRPATFVPIPGWKVVLKRRRRRGIRKLHPPLNRLPSDHPKKAQLGAAEAEEPRADPHPRPGPKRTIYSGSHSPASIKWRVSQVIAGRPGGRPAGRRSINQSIMHPASPPFLSPSHVPSHPIRHP